MAEYNRNDDTTNFEINYDEIASVVELDNDALKIKNKEIIKANTKGVYKHYIKQGLKYALCGLAIVLGGILIFNPALLALPVFAGSGYVFPIIGGILTGLGAIGGVRTRLNRDLNYNFSNDRKKLSFFWRESRRIRRIERNLKKVKVYMSINTQKANFFRNKALSEIKIYENNSYNLYRQTKQELGTKIAKYKSGNAVKRFVFWAGGNRFDNIETIRLAQLEHLNKGALMQLKNADIIRKEAGLPQNERTVSLFENICEQTKENDEKLSDEVFDNLKNRHEIKRCTTSQAYKQAIEKMLNDDKMSKRDFEKLFTDYTSVYDLNGEQIFKECIKHNFGKRNVASTMGIVFENSDLTSISDKIQNALKDKFKEMQDDEKEDIMGILSARQEKAKGKQKETIGRISQDFENAM